MRTRLLIAAILIAATAAASSAQTDLDAFMAQVLTRRDDNWKKLQQYTLEEHETFQLTGPDTPRLYGFRREYTWFPRDGLFIRSPLKADGVAVPEVERRKAEDAWVKQEQARERRREERRGGSPGDAEPRFVSSAYFMRFKFDPGHYALVGHEQLLGRDVLRIEYYPAHYFSDPPNRQRHHDDEEDARIDRKMDKTAFITLWVEPAEHQILQYEFRNIDMDFLPARSIVRIDDLRTSMRMGQPFPGVWLPDTVGMRFGLTLATGDVRAQYDVRYHDYRLAEVKARVR